MNDDHSSVHSSESDMTIEEEIPLPVKVQQQVGPIVDTLWESVSQFPLIPHEQRTAWTKAVSSFRSSALPTFKFAFIGRTDVHNDQRVREIHVVELPPRRSFTAYIGVWVGLLDRSFDTSFMFNRACTSACTEIEYADSDSIEIEIKFQSADEWKEKLEVMLEQVQDNSEKSTERLSQLYPHIADFTGVTVNELMRAGLVKDRLGTCIKIRVEDAAECRDVLRDYVSSSLSSAGIPLWPLVRSMRIWGRFPVLASGITLVDLPGDGDIDDVRNAFANEYIQKADGFILIVDAKRAQDDRPTQEQLEKILGQLVVDGRVVDEAILIVATHTEDAIGDDEVELDVEDRPKLEQLREELAVISRAMKKKRKPSQKDLNMKSQYELGRAFQEKTVDKKRLLADARIKRVRGKLHEVFLRLCSSSGNDSTTGLPIFCVASRDYIALDSLTDPPVVFNDVQGTEIPDLVCHLRKTGELRRVRWATKLVTRASAFSTGIHSYFSEGRHPGRLPIKNRKKALAVLASLEAKNLDEAKEVLEEVEIIFQDIGTDLAEAVGKAVKNALPTMKKFGSPGNIHWSTYKASMRLNGLCPPHDLNRDLTRDILPEIQGSWNIGLNYRIPLILKNAISSMEDTTLEAMQDIIDALNRRSPLFHQTLSAARQTIALEPIFSDLLEESVQTISLAQREGTRCFKSIVQKELTDQYQLVAKESGPGSWARMKHSNQEFIKMNAENIFNPIKRHVYGLLHKALGKVRESMRTQVEELTTLIRLSLIGEFFSPTDTNIIEAKERILQLSLDATPSLILLQTDLADKRRTLQMND
ncbi:hypothetical protein C8F04DRAFT_1401194 [Mycena alexandri]|uniref:Dynamin N-terminal domain-containing protein n=1 Tax=Mycena alexandri TaxID=1745969 RepID=A0AAD6WTJ3_9AGAR|nr:hypothetical protein C8F04DRAFT_1401194 [Mycena alexandri]